MCTSVRVHLCVHAKIWVYRRGWATSQIWTAAFNTSVCEMEGSKKRGQGIYLPSFALNPHLLQNQDLTLILIRSINECLMVHQHTRFDILSWSWLSDAITPVVKLEKESLKYLQEYLLHRAKSIISRQLSPGSLHLGIWSNIWVRVLEELYRDPCIGQTVWISLLPVMYLIVLTLIVYILSLYSF